MIATLSRPIAPTTTAQRGYRLDVRVGQAGLDALFSAWEALAQEVEQPAFFHHPAWYAAYLAALEATPERVCFCALYQGNKLEAILPFKWHHVGIGPLRVTLLALPAHPHMPLGDIILAPSADLAEVARALAIELPKALGFRAPLFLFSKVLEGSGVMRLAAAASGFSALAVPRGHSDFLPPMAYEERLASFSKNFRGNLRKARNKLAGLDPLVATAGSVEELEALYEEFLCVEAQGWKGESGRGSAIVLHPELVLFYRTLLQGFGARGACEIHVLRHGNEAMAVHFALLSRGSYELLKIGYNEAYRQAAPGNMLLERLLQFSGNGGAPRTVNLVSDSAWHQMWQPEQRGVCRLYLCENTLWGKSAHLAAQLWERGRAFYQARVQPALRAARGRSPNA